MHVFATAAEQDAAMRPGTRRLLRLSVPSPLKAVERELSPRTRLVLGANPDGSLQALLDDCVDAATDMLATAPVWTRAEFVALRAKVAAELLPTTRGIVARVEKVLAAANDVVLAMPTTPPPAQDEAIADIRAQLDRLLPRGSPPPARAAAAEVRDIASPIEELRVSLWAQQLGTPRPLVAELPPRECDILTMRFFGSQTQTQIAQKLGISQMHVSRLLARSLAQLRAGLAA